MCCFFYIFKIVIFVPLHIETLAMRTQTIRLHNDIRADFEKLSSIVEYGVQKHTTAWILNNLANKYYKSAKTIENIVFNRTKQDSNEPTLFDSEIAMVS